MSKDLIFNLKHKWFKEFEDGFKNYEFREIKPHWQKRLCKHYNRNCSLCSKSKCEICIDFLPIRYGRIILKDGYPSNDDRKKILTRRYIGASINKIRQDDLAEKEMIGKYCFIIPCMYNMTE